MTRTEAKRWYKRVRNLELTDKNRRKEEVLRRLASQHAYQSKTLPRLWDLPTLTSDGEYDIRMCEAHDLVSSDLIKELFDEGLVTVRIDQGWAMVAGNLTWPVLCVSGR